MARGVTNPDYLNGVPELAVLRVLLDGPQHGYAIVQSISQRTGGCFNSVKAPSIRFSTS